MKILCYGDLHYRETGEFRPWLRVGTDGLTLESHRTLKTSRFIADSILAEKPNIVVNLGDVFNPINTITQTIVWLAGVGMGYIKAAANHIGATHYGIIGNHDLFSSHSKIHSTKILEDPAFTIFEEYNQVIVDGLKLGFVPYHDKRSIFEMEFHNACRTCDLIFTHYTFAGSRFTSVYTEETGIDPNTEKTIIAGHVHVPQDIGNVHYVGTPCQYKTRETESAGVVRGVLIYDTDTKEIKRIKNTYCKDIAFIQRIKDLKKIDPEKYAVRYVGEPVEDIEFAGYEFDKLILRNQTEGIRISYANKMSVNPTDMLQAYVNSNHPELKEVLDEAMKQ
jgi:predicted phosphodiesterase